MWCLNVFVERRENYYGTRFSRDFGNAEEICREAWLQWNSVDGPPFSSSSEAPAQSFFFLNWRVGDPFPMKTPFDDYPSGSRSIIPCILRELQPASRTASVSALLFMIPFLSFWITFLIGPVPDFEVPLFFSFLKGLMVLLSRPYWVCWPLLNGWAPFFCWKEDPLGCWPCCW